MKKDNVVDLASRRRKPGVKEALLEIIGPGWKDGPEICDYLVMRLWRLGFKIVPREEGK